MCGIKLRTEWVAASPAGRGTSWGGGGAAGGAFPTGGGGGGGGHICQE